MLRTALLGIAAVATTAGCTKIYYDTWEALGKEKRELLKDNVEELRDDQKDVGDELQDALTRLKALYDVPGREPTALEKAYESLSADFAEAESKADALRERRGRVETIADDLFTEWGGEIDRMKNERYRADSRRKLAATKARFATLKTSMRKTEKSLGPVMTTFEDQVLYLKHNLNAQALGPLAGEVASIERDLRALAADMQRSIAESEAFLGTLDAPVAH